MNSWSLHDFYPESLHRLPGPPIVPRCVRRNGVWGPYVGRTHRADKMLAQFKGWRDNDNAKG